MHTKTGDKSTASLWDIEDLSKGGNDMSEDAVVLVHARELDAHGLATRNKHHMFYHASLSALVHFRTFVKRFEPLSPYKDFMGLTDLLSTAFGPLGNSSNHLCRVLGLPTVVVLCFMGLRILNNIYSRRVIVLCNVQLIVPTFSVVFLKTRAVICLLMVSPAALWRG